MESDNALTRPDRLFAPFMAHLPGGAWVKDRNGRYVYANRYANERIFLRTVDEILGRTDAELFAADVARQFTRNDRRVVETRQPIQVVETLPLDETDRYSLVDKFPILDADGEVIFVGGIAFDITGHKLLEVALRDALKEVDVLKRRLQRENVYLQQEITTEQGYEGIVGESAALRQALTKVSQVAQTSASVLITGETGTGKELFARAVHSLSGRGDRPLIKVNCAALSAGVIESELFGHQKGAFTGALRQRTGRFELAHEGTIFLDEVCELTPDAQARLLNVLQDGEFEAVGSNRTRKVDVRIITATNRCIDQQMEVGLFRPDLYFRLNVFPIEVPSLRNRVEDIPLLSEHFLKKSAARLGKCLRGFTARSMSRLSDYHWPGNVRELQNIVERAAVLSPGPEVCVDVTMLGIPDSADRQDHSLADIERSHIMDVLERTRWRLSGAQGAAAILDVHPSTLRSRMKKLGINKQR